MKIGLDRLFIKSYHFQKQYIKKQFLKNVDCCLKKGENLSTLFVHLMIPLLSVA